MNNNTYLTLRQMNNTYFTQQINSNITYLTPQQMNNNTKIIINVSRDSLLQQWTERLNQFITTMDIKNLYNNEQKEFIQQ